MIKRMDGGNMRRCGCAAGRPCTCSMGDESDKIHRFNEKAKSVKCGTCFSCKRNRITLKKSGKTGNRKCLNAPAILERGKSDYVKLPELNIDFRMRKSYKRIGTVMYSLLHQMRLAMKERIDELNIQIEEDSLHWKTYTAELVEAQAHRKQIELAEQNDQATKDMYYLDSDVIHGLVAQRVHIDNLEPELKSTVSQTISLINSAKQEIEAIKLYVYNIAIVTIQRIVRGFLCKRIFYKLKSEFWQNASFSAAVEIQSFFRRILSKLKADKIRIANLEEKRNNAAVCIQKYIRAHRCKKEASENRISRHELICKNAARKIQCMCRIYLARKRNIEVSKEIEVQKKRQQNFNCTIEIQRMFRGYCGRKIARRVKINASLSKRVRELADRYITGGNFWDFLEAVNEDYKKHEEERLQEELYAKTFVSTVTQNRDQQQNQIFQEYIALTSQNHPKTNHDDQIRNIYSSRNSNRCSPQASNRFRSFDPQQSRSSKQNHEILQDFLSRQTCDSPQPHYRDKAQKLPRRLELRSLEQESKFKYHTVENYDHAVIKYAMAEGFAFNEIIIGLRGLKASGQSITDPVLLVKALHARAPLMMNSYKSEKTMKKRSMRKPQYCLHRGEDSFGIKSNFDKHIQNDLNLLKSHIPAKHVFNNGNSLLRSITNGMHNSIDELLKIASLQTFEPSQDHDESACFSDSSKSYSEYCLTESPLLKISRERISWKAVEPYIKILKDNNYHYIRDLISQPKLIDNFCSLGIPRKLMERAISLANDLYREINHTHRNTVSRNFSLSESRGTQLNTPSITQCKLWTPCSLSEIDTPAILNARPDTAITTDTILYGEDTEELGETEISVDKNMSGIISAESSDRLIDINNKPESGKSWRVSYSEIPYTNTSSLDSDKLEKVKCMLEEDFFKTYTLDSEIDEFVFQAVFKICPVSLSGTSLSKEHGAGKENYSHFLASVAEVVTVKPELVKAMLQERCRYSARITRTFVELFNKNGLRTIRDLIYCSFEKLEIPDALAAIFRELSADLLNETYAMVARPMLKNAEKLQSHQKFDSRYQTSTLDSRVSSYLKPIKTPSKNLKTKSKARRQNLVHMPAESQSRLKSPFLISSSYLDAMPCDELNNEIRRNSPLHGDINLQYMA